MPVTGALPVGIGADPAAQKEFFDALDQQVKALEGRQNPNWFSIAGALMAPGRSGSFGEAIGNAATTYGKQQEEQEARAPAVAQMRAQIAGQKFQVGQEVKAQGLLINALGGQSIEDTAQQLSTPEGAIANPQTMQRLSMAQMLIPQGTKAADQVKALIETQSKMLDYGLKSGTLSNDQLNTFWKTGLLPSSLARPSAAPAQVAGKDKNVPQVAFDPTSSYGTPTQLLDNLEGVESSNGKQMLNPTSKALGPYQFIPETLVALHDQGVKFNPLDRDQSRSAADWYLSQLYKQTGSWEKALAAYGGFKTKDPTQYVGQVLKGVPQAALGAPAADASRPTAGGQPSAYAKPNAQPGARASYPDGTTINIPVGYPGSEIPGYIKDRLAEYDTDRKATLAHERSVLLQENQTFDKSVQEPLFAAIENQAPSDVANQRALALLDKTPTGFGTSLGMEISKIKGLVLGLSPEELVNFTNQRAIDQAQKTAVAAGVKAAFGGNLSNKETDRYIASLYSIDDPKEFIRAAIEMQRYAYEMKKDLSKQLSQAGGKENKNIVFSNYFNGDRSKELLKQHAPTVYGVINRPEGEAPKPPVETKKAWDQAGNEFVYSNGKWVNAVTGKEYGK